MVPVALDQVVAIRQARGDVLLGFTLRLSELAGGVVQVVAGKQTFHDYFISHPGQTVKLAGTRFFWLISAYPVGGMLAGLPDGSVESHSAALASELRPQLVEPLVGGPGLFWVEADVKEPRHDLRGLRSSPVELNERAGSRCKLRAGVLLDVSGQLPGVPPTRREIVHADATDPRDRLERSQPNAGSPVADDLTEVGRGKTRLARKRSFGKAARDLHLSDAGANLVGQPIHPHNCHRCAGRSLTNVMVGASVRVTMVGARIRQLRQIAGVSARELSRLALLPGACHVSLIESAGAKSDRLRASTAIAVARVLGCSLDWLLMGVGKPPRDRVVRAAVERARARYDSSAQRRVA